MPSPVSPSLPGRRRPVGGVLTLLATAAMGAPLTLAMAPQEVGARGFAVVGPRAGAAYNFGGAGWRGGYQGWHPAYGQGVRPSWNPTNVNFYNRDYHGWNGGWANGGYWNSRPWNAGWYRWTPASWGWWGGSAAAWGLVSLATGAAIASLVNAAAQSQSTVIVVPQTPFQLNYGSIESVGSYGVSFSYSLGYGDTLYGAANCQQGLLNGQVPHTADQAQLLNAVCQVAYGAGS